jgi:hypothetical protein
MSEEIEIETRDLQETIEELHEERREREEQARKAAWTRYIAVTTAVFAVFAALGALQSGALISEAVIFQLQSSDQWNEYQAARQKDHLYSLQAYALLDRGVKPPVQHTAGRRSGSTAAGKHSSGKEKERASGEPAQPQQGVQPLWEPKSPEERLRQYIGQAEKEREKEKELQETAQELALKSRERTHTHHHFAESVALFQVAISLSAIAALTRIKSIWWLSVLVGAGGLFLFAAGTLAPK